MARPRALSRWLLIVAALVFLMIVIGGITRLTESGLSMVRWEPISGAVPPLSEQAWAAEFAAYQATPEYKTVNRGMALSQFKQIYFWEYVHRLLGRLLGLAFALPLAWYWWRRAIPPGYKPRLVALLALGGLQGAIGWWMVKSGLVDRPDVSHIRLAIHLLTALLTFSGLIWTALDLRRLDGDRDAAPARLRAVAVLALAFLAIQLLLGAFTAGLDAGYAFASWPRMGDGWFPEGGWNAGWSAARNLVDNPLAVQFAHRWWAWIAAAGAGALAWEALQTGARRASRAILITVAVQIGLGIATLLSGVALPLAVAHQAAAALLLAAMVVAAHAVGSLPARYSYTLQEKPAFP